MNISHDIKIKFSKMFQFSNLDLKMEDEKMYMVAKIV